MTPPDAGLVLGLNRLAGKVPILDGLVRLTVGDYFIPVSLFLAMLGLWFGPRDPQRRRRNQRGVLLVAIGLGIVAVVMTLFNSVFWFDPWPRPFVAFPQIDPKLLFYPPQDPSFPSHPAAVGFALSTGILMSNRKAGILMYLLTALWGFARVYAGVHYPLDIVGGWVVGACASYLAYKAAHWLEPVLSRVLKGMGWLCLADVEQPKT